MEVATASQKTGGFADCQKRPERVWSAVRAALTVLPRLFTSLKSAAYSALVRAGGGPGRNCEGKLITQGVTCASCGTSPGANPGGGGRHWPGASPPVKGGGAFRKPSVLRQAQIAAATVSPQSIPL